MGRKRRADDAGAGDAYKEKSREELLAYLLSEIHRELQINKAAERQTRGEDVPGMPPEQIEGEDVSGMSPEQIEGEDVPGMSSEQIEGEDVPGMPLEQIEGEDVPGMSSEQIEGEDVPGMPPERTERADVTGMLPEQTDGTDATGMSSDRSAGEDSQKLASDSDSGLVARVEETLSELLWSVLLRYQKEPFYTVKGLEFTYYIRGNELFVDRKDKSITRASVDVALRKAMELGLLVSGPKKLTSFGASYLYPIFLKLGIISKE